MSTLLSLPTLLRHACFKSLLQPTHYSLLRLSSLAAPPEERTYADALRLLNSLQSNRTVRSAISSTQDMNATAIPEMLEWTRKAGYTPSDYAKAGLNVIHVAGTKGKGSVCIMVERILRMYQKPILKSVLLTKIGTFTSPHLVDVRERIRINGKPISQDLFTQYFFEIWCRISSANINEGTPEDERPGYFRYLTILALHAFVKLGVQCCIMECGIGGEYDSTNILPYDAVSVCGITRLELDHVGMLGDTIESIAWHKSGIMKYNRMVYTVEQDPSALAVLEKRALEKKVKGLAIVPLNPEISHIPLGLQGTYQYQNASLALALSYRYLIRNKILREFVRTRQYHLRQAIPALKSVKLPGRCQRIKEGNIEWFIDGAHTHDSIISTATWFASYLTEPLTSGSTKPTAMLIFNQEGDRDANTLLTTLLTELKRLTTPTDPETTTPYPIFKFAIFPTNETWTKDAKDKDLTTQLAFGKIFQEAVIGPKSNLPGIQESNDIAKRVVMAKGKAKLPSWTAYSSVQASIDLVRRMALGEKNGEGKVSVLVTGSLHLVGAVLNIFQHEAELKSTRRTTGKPMWGLKRDLRSGEMVGGRVRWTSKSPEAGDQGINEG